MVKPNVSIYCLAYITQDILSSYLPKIKKLEIQTETIISFNFLNQYFDITGETQDGCDAASTIIIESLIPILSEAIDSNTKMLGTYEDISILNEFLIHLDDYDDVKKDIKYNIEGKPLGEDDKNREQDLDQEAETGVIIEEDPQDHKILIIKEFHISLLISDIQDFMIGPIQFNMQSAEYIDLIPRLTNTDIILLQDKRCLSITGQQDCVNDAYNRFKVIEKSYIAHSNITLTHCIHYPKSSGRYGLFFCDLALYKHKKFVHIQLCPQKQLSKLYVLLPVFPDSSTGEYARPKDLIVKNTPSSNNYHRHQAIEDQQQTRKKEDFEKLAAAFAQIEDKILENPAPALVQQPKTKSKRSVVTANVNASVTISTSSSLSTSPTITSASSFASHSSTTATTTRTNTPNYYNHPQETFSSAITTNKKTDHASSSSSPSSVNKTPPPSPPSVYEFILPQVPEDNLHNFPTLSPSPTSRSTTPINGLKSKKLFKPTLAANKTKTSRILRIVPQKSSAAVAQLYGSIPKTTSVIDQVKAYNYNNIKVALETSLDSLRGFKGEIKLSAKIGKVLWTNVSSIVKGQIWEYQDINDIVVKELGARPRFTNITTIDDDMIEIMSSENILPTQPFNKTAIYEFHCSARNQPSLPYKHTVIHMNQGVIDVRKVVLKEKTITEVDWVSLDRKYDFQLSLSTKQLTRCDVKPYITFIKRISICPITRLMTYENVPKFLDVDYILFKQTKKYRFHSPFVVEITRVEKVPTKPVEGTVKINAYTGSGDVWYDFEVRNTINDTAFEANKELEVGKEAHWTASEILGFADNNGDSSSTTTTDTITDYVKNMLIIVEKIERAINSRSNHTRPSTLPPL